MCKYVKIYKIQYENAKTFCAKILHISTDKNVQHVFVLIWGNQIVFPTSHTILRNQIDTISKSKLSFFSIRKRPWLGRFLYEGTHPHRCCYRFESRNR